MTNIYHISTMLRVIMVHISIYISYSYSVSNNHEIKSRSILLVYFIDYSNCSI